MTKRSASQTGENWRWAFLSALGLHITLIATSIMFSIFFNRPMVLPPAYNVKIFDMSQMPASKPSPRGNPEAKANTAPKIGREAKSNPKALPPVPKIPESKPKTETQVKKIAPPPKPIEKKAAPQPKPREAVQKPSNLAKPKPKPEKKAEVKREESPKKPKPPAPDQKELLDKRLKAIQEHVHNDKLLDKKLGAIQEHVQTKQDEALIDQRIAMIASKLEKKGAAKGAPDDTSGDTSQSGGGQIDNEALRLYLGQVASSVQSKWAIPDQFLNKKDLLCIISFEINSDGSITNVQIEKRSGEAMLDQAAFKAVKDAAPFLPLPKAIGTGPLDLGLRFTPTGVTL